MSTMSDKEIQELVDQGILHHKAEEFIIYKNLFEELDIMPEVKLPYNFSSNVIRRFEESKSTKSKFRIYTYTAVAAIICLAIAGLILNEILGNEANDLYSWLFSNKWVILFITVSISLIQLLDHLYVNTSRTYSN